MTRILTDKTEFPKNPCISVKPVANLSREFRRQRIARPFGIPQNRKHPPALAVVQQLDAVNTPLEGLRRWTAPRRVAAEHLRHISKTFRPVDDGLLVKRIFSKNLSRIAHKFVHIPRQYHLRSIRSRSHLRKTRLR